MYENKPIGGPGSGRGIFMSGFAQRQILTQRQKSIQRWPVEQTCIYLWLRKPWKQVALYITCIQFLLDQNSVSKLQV